MQKSTLKCLSYTSYNTNKAVIVAECDFAIAYTQTNLYTTY